MKQDYFTFLNQKKKYKRKHQTRYIKEDYCYSIKNTSIKFNVHKRTVSKWIEKGLRVEIKSKPYLILGKDLKAFLEKQNNSNKITTKPYEIACLKCRKSAIPINNTISIYLHNPKVVMIKAKCSICNSTLNKAQSIKKISIYNVSNMKQLETLFRLYRNQDANTKGM